MNIQSKKIFVIGFNKCGTSSFHHFFQQNGIRSLHWGGQNHEENGALILLKNFMLGRDILLGIDTYDAFSDLSYANDSIYIEGNRFFKELYSQYPKAYFILNTRPVDKWITSRLRHGAGSLKARSMKVYNCNEVELIDLWKDQYLSHSEAVTSFFNANGGALLEFDIESDSPQKLVEFLSPIGSFDASYWRQKNKTKK